MKTTEENRESLNDILFTGRNKEYGAYEIRKKYEKYLILAFMISTGMLMLGISVPLIANYYNSHYSRNIEEKIGGVIFGPVQPPPPETPPPPLPDEKLLDKQSRFLKPIITIDTTQVDENFGRQDILNTGSGIKPIDTMSFAADTSDRHTVIEQPKKIAPFTVVEEMPEFIGGESERMKFLRDNVHYPKDANEYGIEGTVYIEFIVEETGNISGINIIKGIGGGCDEEAIRVAKMMKYLPGRQAGIAVPVKFTMPIKFMLAN